VKRDEPIVELETDKVTLEVNAPSDGVISKIIVGEGQNVGVGAILGELSAANDAAKPTAAPAPAPAPKQEAPKAAAPVAAPAPVPARQEAPKQQPANEDMKLSPAVRKMLADNNLDASQIQPSGRDGRVSKEDVEKFVARERQRTEPYDVARNTGAQENSAA
jgi:2-oxoglutarate dehydrogenase E2 component (dihydrolipoamide succinyltransferase)